MTAVPVDGQLEHDAKQPLTLTGVNEMIDIVTIFPLLALNIKLNIMHTCL